MARLGERTLNRGSIPPPLNFGENAIRARALSDSSSGSDRYSDRTGSSSRGSFKDYFVTEYGSFEACWSERSIDSDSPDTWLDSKVDRASFVELRESLLERADGSPISRDGVADKMKQFALKYFCCCFSR